MTPPAGYAVTSLLIVSIPTVVLFGAADGGTRTGVLVAAGVAYPVMVGSFALMVRFRGAGNRFLVAWAGGILARLLALGGTALAVVRFEELAPAPTLLALAGFFFVLLMLEPVFFRRA
jgi:hypothetical protein